jgi:hypothetical protein
VKNSDDFYIGYEAKLPRSFRSAICGAIAGFVVALVVAASIATAMQRALPDARFAFGHVESYAGWLSLKPTPALLVQGRDGVTRYWLVAPGKFGPAKVLGDVAEGPVQLDATPISREHWKMLEVVEGSIRHAAGIAPPSSRDSTARRVRIRGEVVDSKCFLGVMNPGEGAAHRDCAVRCLSGGVPRMFAYRDANDTPHLALLLTSHPIDPGRSVELAGDLVITGDEEVFIVETP